MESVDFFRNLSMLLSFIFLSLSATGQSKVSHVLPLQGICAHRGAMQTHPENTIAAFKEAIRVGVQMIEFDVRLTKDGELIIMHDETVDRTTNGSGFVNDLTLSELRKLDAGSWKSEEFTGEKVPTLKEVLQIMPKNIWLNIHLKGGKKLGVETAKLVISEKREHQAVIACERQSAKGVRKVDSEIKICNMERLSSRSKYIAATKKQDYVFIQLKKSRDNNSLKNDVEDLKKNGIHVNYVQADEAKEISVLLDLGVDFIFTDDLVPMVRVFNRYTALHKSRK
ncbi:glycerophosphodiester phosphodiesterase [Ulvibacterium marinum]|uniref:glycerophosphodiester phosphodiesterase n=1 Tax=Ulvibacterium marinum TaxID=2419782 RepID=UPI002493D048|nr:glycerophosphodiester phosphodiesterase family protein [Ulvibacterium marinum]